MANYICPALGDCARANAREVFDLPIADDNKCPECDSELKLLDGEPTIIGSPGIATPSKTRSKGSLVAMIGIPAVILLAGGVYMAMKPPLPVIEPNPKRPPGIAPSAQETEAAKTASEDALKNGKAADAQKEADKAAANELMKSAIAKLSQNKLDDADKDLEQAKQRDPEQSLVYYNIGILRLRQGKTDEAIKAFEQCFAKGGAKYSAEMERDRDLDKIRKDPRFVDLQKRYPKPAT